MFLLHGISDWTMAKAQKISPRDIKIILDDEEFVQARVRGTYDYSVEISRNDDSILGNCTCPAFDQEGECKHVGALWFNLPPTFRSSLDPGREYFYFDEFFPFDNEIAEEQPLPSFDYQVPTKSITNLLKQLERIKEISAQEEPLQKFLNAPHSELVYQLRSYRFSNALTAEIKCKQLLKNGEFGKVKNLSAQNIELLEQLPPFLKPHLRDHQYERFLVFSGTHLGETFQRFIRECEVYDIHERRFEWLNAQFDLTFEIDSESRTFMIQRSFSDGVKRSHLGLIYSLGIGFFENYVFRSRYKWDESILSELIPLQGRVFQEDEWHQFQRFLLKNMPQIIGGDKFHLNEQTLPPRFEIHLRYFSPERIIAMAIADSISRENMLLKEDLSLRQKSRHLLGSKLVRNFF